ncbi:MAG TPA: crotonase, partial [Tetrasphaera sp.]|nr:crotonase [Tetrasphaera sp.]
ELAASAPLATGATKTAINAASLDLAAAIGREETGQEALLHTADFREGVGAFNGKRAARFHGA